jgi:hypothetical protein
MLTIRPHPPLDHAREQRVTELDRRTQVDGDLAIPFLRLRVEEGDDPFPAGAVDQDVDRTAAERVLGQSVHAARIGQLNAQGSRVRERPGEGPSALEVEVGHDHGRADRRKVARDRRADTARRPRDHCPASFQ